MCTTRPTESCAASDASATTPLAATARHATRRRASRSLATSSAGAITLVPLERHARAVNSAAGAGRSRALRAWVCRARARNSSDRASLVPATQATEETCAGWSAKSHAVASATRGRAGSTCRSHARTRSAAAR
jgi:hypothetical protein